MTLSKEAQDKINSWTEFKTDINRISWDQKWLGQAFLNSKRSHDGQTKCGAVIVTDDNLLVSEGYNGFPRDIDDTVLPNLRPEKYPWFQHAERNAIYNAAREGRQTKGTICYVTGLPCFECTLALYQAGIKHIVYGINPTHMQSIDSREVPLEIFKYLTKDKLDWTPIEVDKSILEYISRC